MSPDRDFSWLGAAESCGSASTLSPNSSTKVLAESCSQTSTVLSWKMMRLSELQIPSDLHRHWAPLWPESNLILFFLTFLPAIFLSTWVLSILKSRPALPGTGHEPPVAPYCIPYLQHLVAFLWDPNKAFRSNRWEKVLALSLARYRNTSTPQAKISQHSVHSNNDEHQIPRIRLIKHRIICL